MKKMLKYLGYAFALLFGLFLLAVAYIKNKERIDAYYSRLLWRLPTQAEQIRVGDSENDVIFKLGQPIQACEVFEGDKHCFWRSNRKNTVVLFRDSMVSYVSAWAERSSFSGIPFKDVETMEFILGKPDIFSESKDFSNRRYTYLYEDQKDSGVTFDFESNSLSSYGFGKLRWRRVANLGRYDVEGVQICPGEQCPWDKKDNLRDEFKGKDARVFMKR